MAAITLTNIRKAYGGLSVIHGVDIAIEDGEFLVLVGPSGCGKSTLLRMIAGLEEISDGDLMIGDIRVNALAPAERDIAMVFQDYALYPHMSVRENMAFGLKMRGRAAADVSARVDQAASALRIGDFLERRPAQLSGGQRQRVAMGRAIVREPSAFLFDEPLSNLDASLRVEMRLEIARLHKRMQATTVYVTHDQVEAMTLADRIVVMNAGRVEQIGRPLDLYHRPESLFVARFIGSPTMNTLPARVGDDGASLTLCGRTVPFTHQALAAHKGEEIIVGVRPEHLLPCAAQEAWFSGELAVAERLGSQTFGYVDIAQPRMFSVEFPREATIEAGQAMALRADPAHVHLFDAATGRRLHAAD